MNDRLQSQPSQHRLAKTVGGTLVVAAMTALSVSPALAQTSTTQEETTTTTAAETTTTEAESTTTTAEETTTTTAETDSGQAPVGGADTGVGGMAADDGIDPLLGAGSVAGLAAVGAAVTYAVRRRGADV